MGWPSESQPHGVSSAHGIAEPGNKPLQGRWMGGIYLLASVSRSLRLALQEINMRVCVLSRFSHVKLFATRWTSSLPDSYVHMILQARILEWVAMPSSRGSF